MRSAQDGDSWLRWLSIGILNLAGKLAGEKVSPDNIEHFSCCGVISWLPTRGSDDVRLATPADQSVGVAIPTAI
jgi:hypothetical protein